MMTAFEHPCQKGKGMADQKQQQARIPDDSRTLPLNHDSQAPARAAKRLYSIEEAAHYLALSPWTIRELIWNGTLPHVRIGRRILLDRQDLDGLILHHKSREV
jgi:excisionase family DNA binding protein